MASKSPSQYSGSYCAVVGCHARRGRDPVSFFKFPARNHEQRELWIRAVKRINVDGTPWVPGKYALVCGKHFVKKKPSPTNSDPDYVPTIFPTNHMKAATQKDIQRNQRKLDRRRVMNKNNVTIDEDDGLEENLENDENDPMNSTESSFSEKSRTNDACVGTFHTPSQEKKVQTDNIIHGFSRRVYSDKDCKPLTGVSYALYQNLCQLLAESVPDSKAMTREEKIVLYLFKLRHNNSFSCIAILYGIHKVTVSSYFHQVLDAHYEMGSKFVWWIPRSLVDATMPEAFKQHHPTTRVIIDASEVRCEQPSQVEAQVFLYSNYKSSFTMKFLIGNKSAFLSFLKSHINKLIICYFYCFH